MVITIFKNKISMLIIMFKFYFIYLIIFSPFVGCYTVKKAESVDWIRVKSLTDSPCDKEKTSLKCFDETFSKIPPEDSSGIISSRFKQIIQSGIPLDESIKEGKRYWLLSPAAELEEYAKDFVIDIDKFHLAISQHPKRTESQKVNSEITTENIKRNVERFQRGLQRYQYWFNFWAKTILRVVEVALKVAPYLLADSSSKEDHSKIIELLNNSSGGDPTNKQFLIKYLEVTDDKLKQNRITKLENYKNWIDLSSILACSLKESEIKSKEQLSSKIEAVAKTKKFTDKFAIDQTIDLLSSNVKDFNIIREKEKPYVDELCNELKEGAITAQSVIDDLKVKVKK